MATDSTIEVVRSRLSSPSAPAVAELVARVPDKAGGELFFAVEIRMRGEPDDRVRVVPVTTEQAQVLVAMHQAISR